MSDMNNIAEKSIRCDCSGGEHYLHFFGFKDDHRLYIEINAKSISSFSQRIKEAWKVLCGKENCYDGIILEKEKSMEIIEFLNSFWGIKI
jgi:hypothetical protein